MQCAGDHRSHRAELAGRDVLATAAEGPADSVFERFSHRSGDTGMGKRCQGTAGFGPCVYFSGQAILGTYFGPMVANFVRTTVQKPRE